MRPSRPPYSCQDCTTPTTCCRAAGASAATSGMPGTMRGMCWIAPNAAPNAHANMIVVTIVVFAYAGANSSPRLGRFSVPACFFCCQIGDSGRKGRITRSGIAGTSPEISV